MMQPVRHRWIYALLILLVLTSGVLAAVQSAQHGDMHQVADSAAHTSDSGWHSHRHVHHDDHDAAAIEEADDAHGHYFHVHLPALALMSSDNLLAAVATTLVIPSADFLLPLSYTQAPPVPPPNA